MIRLCRIANLNITQAVKLPYLVDVVATRALGEAITEGAHEAWKYGVVTSQAWKHLDSPLAPTAFVVHDVPFSDEKKVDVAANASDGALSASEREIVDYVAKEFASLSASELGLMTKYMNPSIPAWGGNRLADTGSDAFERMSRDYQDLAREAAGVTLDSLRRTSRPAETLAEMLA